MIFEELEKYKVAVSISDSELISNNISLDDIMERNEKGWSFLRETKIAAVNHTGREWPGCAFSMEMKVMPNKGIIIVFSEMVADFVNGLKNSQKIADHGSILLRELIKRIEAEDEEGARKIIRDFEQSVRTVQ